jgi:hypothetical protein
MVELSHEECAVMVGLLAGTFGLVVLGAVDSDSLFRHTLLLLEPDEQGGMLVLR